MKIVIRWIIFNVLMFVGMYFGLYENNIFVLNVVKSFICLNFIIHLILSICPHTKKAIIAVPPLISIV